MKFLRTILLIQATYILVTAISPLVNIESFMAVTGYKTDVWLVKTVGALLLPIATCLYMHVFIQTDHRPVIALGSLAALAFICIDFYYALTDVISDIYLADAFLEIIFLMLWVYVMARKRF